ncbi:UNVERIFIED_CONTAM: hypothetical protein Sradi_5219200 [Sesamum radiatum]|uniref:Endonuclease/exonuclease/phosphatase domain-containing protein n=1 Tax=Sesamum radiatum TaxID=300843 RepID=A0AAW2LJY0_SESRA
MHLLLLRVTDDAPVIANVSDLHDSANATVNATSNAASSLHLHVLIHDPPVYQNPNRPSQVEVTSPDDFNYEDPLIAELLDKNWVADKISRKVFYANIEASEGEEELTPISNRFQSLEDMEIEDILQHIENRQNHTSTEELFADVPWLVGGDFNVILHSNENQGGDMSRMGPIDDFNDMVSDIGLIDAGFEGEPFTWTNKRIWRRLDRVLYSKEWTETLNNTRVMHLPRRLSNHHPLFINTAKMENKKPSSFRFQNM